MATRNIHMRDILSPKAIISRLDVPAKKDVIQHMAQLAATLTGKDAAAIFNVLWEREKLGATGVGLGIAIPHARLEGMDRVQGYFARLAKPIAYDSIDEKPVDLVFLLLAPEQAGADHLHALATVSRLLRDQRLCDQLRRAKDEKDLYQLLTETQVVEAA